LPLSLWQTKSGKVFAQGRSDWKWLFEQVPSKLRQLHQEGSASLPLFSWIPPHVASLCPSFSLIRKRVVIFTNQSGIGGKGWDESKETAICGKIQDVIKEARPPSACAVRAPTHSSALCSLVSLSSL
jgi:hypothetical protein